MFCEIWERKQVFLRNSHFIFSKTELRSQPFCFHKKEKLNESWLPISSIKSDGRTTVNIPDVTTEKPQRKIGKYGSSIMQRLLRKAVGSRDLEWFGQFTVRSQKRSTAANDTGSSWQLSEHQSKHHLLYSHVYCYLKSEQCCDNSWGRGRILYLDLIST